MLELQELPSGCMAFGNVAYLEINKIRHTENSTSQ
jgi:hypothetical protein